MRYHRLAVLLAMSSLLFAAIAFAQDESFERAMIDYNAGDYKTAHDIILPLAEHGNPEASNLLGMMYDLGQGVHKDPARAVVYYRKAAKLGNVYGQFNLAVAYNTGVGIPMNYRAAVKWYRRAAEQNANFAQYSLATMYEDGTGVEKSASQAAYWYQKAAENGSMQAQNNLGWMYERGVGVEKNLITAYAWLDTANVQGLKSAANERDRVAYQLTKDEFTKARRLADQFVRDYSADSKR